MKKLIAAIFLFLVCAMPAVAAPDYSELNNAGTNFIRSLDLIVKELPAATNAVNAARIIDIFSSAIDTIGGSMERFRAKHPDLVTQKEVPPEFAAVYAQLSRMGTEYAAVPRGIAELTRRFGHEPIVKEAMARFKTIFEKFEKMRKQTP